jgi:hypothetical protein
MTSKTTQALCRGRVIFHDVETYAEHHELPLAKTKWLIMDILGAAGMEVEFRKGGRKC